MPEPEKGNCRSCLKPVLWFKTAATGSLIPLDPKPVPTGNVVIRDGKAVVLKKDLFETVGEGERRYVSHFSTCEFAGRHRKGKK